MASIPEPSAGSPSPARVERGRYVERLLQADFARPAGSRPRAGSYRAFVPASLGNEQFTLSASTSELAQRAALAVAELNASTPKLMSLEGMARQLLRSEALASSKIEGLELSHRTLAEASVAERALDRAQEVLANMHAMEEAISIGSRSDEITSTDVRAIHAALAIVPPLDRRPGEYRDEQGFIGGTTPLDAEYVAAPEGEIPRLVDDLCEFMNRDDVPAVAQAAIAHSQFELIHPFEDGNGRVGRCLIHVLLRRRGLAPRYVPPVSLVLGANKDRYIAGIQAFRAGRVEAWLDLFARAVATASSEAERFSNEVTALQEKWLEQAGPLRRDAVARTIIENLPRFPFVNVAAIKELSGKSDVAILNGFERLEQAGVVTKHENRRKGNTWEAKELFELLNEFEQRVRMP